MYVFPVDPVTTPPSVQLPVEELGEVVTLPLELVVEAAEGGTLESDRLKIVVEPADGDTLDRLELVAEAAEGDTLEPDWLEPSLVTRMNVISSEPAGVGPCGPLLTKQTPPPVSPMFHVKAVQSAVALQKSKH